MLRRSALPFRSTQGFNPRPRLVFALSLPLGVIGCAEVVELELLDVLPVEEVRDRLIRQTPPGLAILDVRRIPPATTAHVRALCYSVPLPLERLSTLPERIALVMASPDCWVERTRPPRRRLDIRPFLRALHIREEREEPLPQPLPETERGARTALPPLSASGRGLGGGVASELGEGKGWLDMELWLTPTGTARPEEVLTVLGLPEFSSDGAAGAVLERRWLELEDESRLPEERPQREPLLTPDADAPTSVSPDEPGLS
jgi:hypothetical protein